MKNFVMPGSFGVPVVTPVAVTSGQLCVIGSLFGVAAIDAPAGGTVTLALEGIFDLAKVVADSHNAGDIAKVNASGIVDNAGSGAIGWVTQSAAAGTTTARVRLCPSVGSPALAAAETHKPGEGHHHEPVGAGAKRSTQH